MQARQSFRDGASKSKGPAVMPTHVFYLPGPPTWPPICPPGPPIGPPPMGPPIGPIGGRRYPQPPKGQKPQPPQKRRREENRINAIMIMPNILNLSFHRVMPALC